MGIGPFRRRIDGHSLTHRCSASVAGSDAAAPPPDSATSQPEATEEAEAASLGLCGVVLC